MKLGYAILFSLILFAILSAPVSAITATINIPEKYSEVNAGDRIYFETDIKWPENNVRKDLRIEYFIKNNENEEVAYLKVLKAIETQASFMDFINIPESTKSGSYVLYLSLSDYKELDEEIAVSFNVIENSNDIINIYLLLGAIGLILGFIVIKLFIPIKK